MREKTKGWGDLIDPIDTDGITSFYLLSHHAAHCMFIFKIIKNITYFINQTLVKVFLHIGNGHSVLRPLRSAHGRHDSAQI